MLTATEAGGGVAPKLTVSELSARALTAESIAKEVADVAVGLALESIPGEWCHSFLFPRSYFEREVIETVEVVGGIRRAAPFGELVRIEFNHGDLVPVALKVRRLLCAQITALLEGGGHVLHDTPEGLKIVLSDGREIARDHS